MRIAVDAMGGDFAPRNVVDGALAATRHFDIGVTLVGRRHAIDAELARYPMVDRDRVRIVEAADVISMEESPAAALRRKPGASIRVAADMVAQGRADALVSAGHTGATVMAAHGAFGMVAGVDRPALAATIPTRQRPAVLLDVGASVECRPQHLLQFAVMGGVYARVGLDIESPRIGLLSIGEEETKGNDLTREAHRLLKAGALEFIGNIEARDVYAGGADVIVCDGFTGNIALKVSEGLVEMIGEVLRDGLGGGDAAAAQGRAGGAFEVFHKRVDYSEYGGAPLVGVAGLTLVGHGRSSAKAVQRGIEMAHRFAESGLIDRIQQGIIATGV